MFDSKRINFLVNIVKMEQTIYHYSGNPDFRNVRPPDTGISSDLELEAFIAKLKSAPPEKLAVLAER